MTSAGAPRVDPLPPPFDTLRIVADFNPADADVADLLEDVLVYAVNDTLYVRWQAGAAVAPVAWPVRTLAFQFDSSGTVLARTPTWPARQRAHESPWRPRSTHRTASSQGGFRGCTCAIADEGGATRRARVPRNRPAQRHVRPGGGERPCGRRVCLCRPVRQGHAEPGAEHAGHAGGRRRHQPRRQPAPGAAADAQLHPDSAGQRQLHSDGG